MRVSVKRTGGFAWPAVGGTAHFEVTAFRGIEDEFGKPGDPAGVTSVWALLLATDLVEQARTVDGVTFTWIRRTRRDGDSWEAVEVPLGETNEAYELDVLDGATVKRTLTTNTPVVLYAAADELADFGSAQAALSVRVVQLSATVGRGYAAESILTA